MKESLEEQLFELDNKNVEVVCRDSGLQGCYIGILSTLLFPQGMVMVGSEKLFVESIIRVREYNGGNVNM